MDEIGEVPQTSEDGQDTGNAAENTPHVNLLESEDDINVSSEQAPDNTDTPAEDTSVYEAHQSEDRPHTLKNPETTITSASQHNSQWNFDDLEHDVDDQDSTTSSTNSRSDLNLDQSPNQTMYPTNGNSDNDDMDTMMNTVDDSEDNTGKVPNQNLGDNNLNTEQESKRNANKFPPPAVTSAWSSQQSPRSQRASNGSSVEAKPQNSPGGRSGKQLPPGERSRKQSPPGKKAENQSSLGGEEKMSTSGHKEGNDISQDGENDEIILTEEELTDLQAAYNVFDKNGVGFIDPHMLGSVMKFLGHNPTEAEVQDLISASDEKGEGTIDFEDFKKMMTPKLREAEKSKDLQHCFKVFDRDGNGIISMDDLEVIFSHLGQSFTRYELRDMLEAADLDGDKKVTFDDFLEVMKIPMTKP